ncbi:phosphatidylcholine translocator ABCB4-like [Cephus cinctus]|uniref:Phosphatidylcholine translocator ABCB4-like n=1 Tax=Cephus cinctus TaxID=211228 RepID=A0AAJ7RTH5_CEPCN|nr:phosphatidylcholine translocator ABCB4-like [Cephus cinctus]
MKRHSNVGSVDYYPKLRYSFPQFWFGCWTDVVLTLIGLLAAILSGFCVPGTIILYGNLAESFVQYHIHNAIKGINETSEFPVGFRGYNDQFRGTSKELAKETLNFAIYSLFFAICQMIFTMIFIICLNHAAINESIQARQIHFKVLLRQNIAWFDSQNPEDLASRSIRDTSYLESGLGEKLGMFVSSTIAACNCILVALYYGSKLAGTLLVILPIIAVIICIAKWANEYMREQEDFFYKPAELIAEECLTNIRTVLAYSGESHESKKYVEKLVLVENCETTKGTINGIVGAIIWFLMYSMYGFALWYGVNLLKIEQSYTVATLIVVFFCLQICVLHTLQLPQYLHIIEKSNAASRKIIGMMKNTSEMKITNVHVSAAKTEVGISFRNVFFRYTLHNDLASVNKFIFT